MSAQTSYTFLDLTNQGQPSQNWKADLDLGRACESMVCRPSGLKIRNAAEMYNFIKRSASSNRPEGENIEPSNRTMKI